MMDLKDELANIRLSRLPATTATAQVKRVISADEGIVEDPDHPKRQREP